MMTLYLRSQIRLHGVVLNELVTGTNLPIFYLYHERMIKRPWKDRRCKYEYSGCHSRLVSNSTRI